MKLDIDVTDKMIRDILLVEYSSIQEQVNGYNAILDNSNYNPDEDIPYRNKDVIQEEADYYTKLRDAMRIVVNYYEVVYK
jgi:hypothetical protein